VLCGDKYKNEVVAVDAVRTAFGRAGEKDIFWNTRAVLSEFGRRNLEFQKK
jgi:hypothetical protein